MIKKTAASFLLILILSSCYQNKALIMNELSTDQPEQHTNFEGTYAYELIEKQMSFGPRTPASEGHELTQALIIQTLVKFDWQTELQDGLVNGFQVNNIIGKRGEGKPWIILGAHYDTRIFADKDPNPENHIHPVPGANDGASGVAILLELARVIPKSFPLKTWMVFFDSEDNGGIENRELIMGSSLFVNKLTAKPDLMVLVDMVADEDLKIYFEKNSDKDLAKDIWDAAESLGYGDYFVPRGKYRLIDDHIPFLKAGIPSVDIIDFDYPYWHTIEDTIEKTSVHSLQIVGDTILSWLMSFSP